MRPKNKVFQQIGNITAEFIKRYGISKQIKTSLTLEKFTQIANKILSKDIISEIKPVYLKNKVLAVACLSSIAAQELQYHEKDILDRLNMEMDDKIVEKIKYLI